MVEAFRYHGEAFEEADEAIFEQRLEVLTAKLRAVEAEKLVPAASGSIKLAET